MSKLNLKEGMNFHLSIPKPNEQYLHIECSFAVNQEQIQIYLPSWRPGRYELANFAKNIRGLKVFNEDNQLVPFSKSSKDSWMVNAGKSNYLKIKYQYYSNELNAGSTCVSENILYVNPVNCFIYTKEHLESSIEIDLNIPESWQIATSLSISDKILTASSFDALFDAPFICSNSLSKNSYTVQGIVFNIWFNDHLDIPWEKLIYDFERFTSKQIEDFGEFPSKEFHFLIHTPPFKAYHGVEHLNSTVIALGPSYDVFKGLYSELLGVSSHELYHVWNVKSIRPKAMRPYDFRNENYSKLGYIYEGITTYMGDLYLLKSGVFTIKEYLKELQVQFQRHFDNPARFYTSVGASSYDTWLDGYIQGAPGRKVSIYVEGCLIAFVTDYLIRKNTQNKYGIEEVMRRLYYNTEVSKEGYDEKDYQHLLESISGVSFESFFENYINGTHSYEPILQDALAYFGLEMNLKNAPLISENSLGIKLKPIRSKYIIHSFSPGSPADMCGLRAGDEIIAVNDIKLDSDLDQWLSYFNIRDIRLTIVRDQIIIDKKIPVVHRSFYPKYTLNVLKEKSPTQLKALQSWVCAGSL
jgi:predicted metalloprotease with PDZ domain